MTVEDAPSDLWRWSGRALRDGISSGELGAVEVAQAHLDRIRQANPALNALIEVSEEEALDTARELDQRGRGGDRSGLMHGIPVSIKDNTDQAGHANTGGLVAAATNLASEDAAVVAALRASGSVFIGRSNVPAFSLRWFSENDLFGRTLNPWSTGRTPGGSSGGAASAVASGMVPIAHGNDIGGSIRYPAAVCGVTGIRPTVGRVPKWAAPSPYSGGAAPADHLMSVEGPIARHVTDLRLALEAMSAPDLRDPACVPVRYQDEAPLPKGTAVGVVAEIPGVPTTAAHLDALERAAGWLRNAGYETVEVEVSELAEAHRLWLLLLFEDLRADLAVVLEHGDEQLRRSLENDFAVVAEAWGPRPSLAAYVHGHSRRNELVTIMEERFAGVPLLLTPFSAQVPPRHLADAGSTDGARALIHDQWPMTSVACLGLPAATVPVGVVDNLPTGVQIIGGRFRESWILDAAEAIEARAPRISPLDPASV